MGNAKRIAVVGATGAVGIEMMETLEKRNFPISSMKLLASSRSAGKKLKFKGEDITVEELKEDSFKDVDIALFAAGGSETYILTLYLSAYFLHSPAIVSYSRRLTGIETILFS